jgi:hypothetical protein
VITSVIDISTGLPDPAAQADLTFNCLGWAVGDGDFIIDAGNTAEINAILGINSVSSAISSGTFSNNFSNIQQDDVLILLDGNGNYVHAAIYQGSGIYISKNGMGDGQTGTTSETLQSLEALYGTTNAYWIKPPPESNTPSNLGGASSGDTTLGALSNAMGNCKCN